MYKYPVIIAICQLLFVGISVGGRVDISLNPADWMDNGTVTSARALTQAAEGYLRATCNTYRGHINYRTKDTFNFQGATIRYKWRANCAGNYSWTQDGAYPWGRMSTYALSTNHSWASSIVISSNTWIYTEIKFNDNRTWSGDYSYTGYGNGGINHNSGTITEANWELLAASFLSKLIGDGYANSFYYEIAEAYYETPGPQVQIISPAEGAVFDPNEMISFSATATGGTLPYTFEWESDIEGVLGSGETLQTALLSQGIHTITLTCSDAGENTGSASITVSVLVKPIIESIAPHTITDSGSYTGPVPVLLQGQSGTSWSLVEGPAGMTINSATGQVLWPVPTTSGSPYTVTIRAENPKGADETSWQIEVIKTPSFATMLWAAIQDGQRGIDGHDAFTRTAIDLEGNVLAAGYLDSVAGHQDAAYLVKYSPEGSIIWSKTIDAPSYSGKAEYNDRFTDVAVDSDNNVIVVGSKSGNWTNYSLGSYHTVWWVQKYTPDGQTLLWEKLWQDTSSSAWQGANGVCIDAADNIYVTGSSFGAWSTIEQQWVTFKYDKDGNVLLGPIKANFVVAYYLPDYSYDIAVDAAGNMYVAGARGVSGSDGGTTNNADWHVRKYNAANGTTVWQDTYSGAAGLLDYAMGTVLDSQGNLLVVGYSNKGSNNTTNLDYDWLMIKYDGATGARLWTQTYESRPGASEVCYQAVVDDNDDFYVSGYLQNAEGVLQRRIAKISGIDGTTLAEAVWQSDTNSYLTGLARRGDLLAAAGMLSNGTDNDAFVSLLTVSSAVKILSPAFNTWVEAGSPITFNAELVGFAEPPYYYSWSSDKDGLLGTGHTLEVSSLSLGEHLITCRLECGDGQTIQTTTRVIVAVMPEVAPLGDQIIPEGQTYSGPIPHVNDEAYDVTWSLIEGPTGMTINAGTGVVAWANPVGSDEPYTITIQAENPLGIAQISCQLSVLSLPDIETPPAQAAMEYVSFASLAPNLLKGALPVTWSLVSAPASMTIDADTGVVSWSNPVPSFSAYSVTIRAVNSVGSDTATFSIMVYSTPVIATITDKTILVGQAFSVNPVLIKGVPAVTWSLDHAPDGMTIDSQTGQIYWPDPAPEGSTQTVTVRAVNTMGSSTQSFTVRVMLPPVFSQINNDTVHEGTPYTKALTLLQGTAPITFSLLSAPSGMIINASTGELSQAYPNGNNSPYTVTIQAVNAVGTAQSSFTLTVLQRPVIKPIAAALTAENTPYTSSAPGLYQGSAPITWELLSAPSGMSINEQTGSVNWPSAVYSGSPYTVTLQARNVVGSHTQSWQITVVQSPVIAPYGDQVSGNATAYIAPLPTLTQGSYITWSLDDAPNGMSIDATTGQIIWPSPAASEEPHTVTIRAQNIAGTDTETFMLTIHAKPLLAPIANKEISENRPYVSSAAELLAGQLPVAFSLIQSPSGMSIDPAAGVISWPMPTAVGSPHSVRLRATNAYGSDEKTFAVVVPIGYAAQAWVDMDTAPAGTPVPIHGRANYLSDGTEAAGAVVHLQVKLRNTIRLFKPVTNAEGEFHFTFTPFSGEAGQYEVYAGHPLLVSPEPQDSFTLVALRASDTKTRLSLLEGQWYEAAVNLSNPGNTALTTIQASKIGGADSIEIEFDPLEVLPGDATLSVTLRIRAVDASTLQSPIPVQFTSAEGATATITYISQIIPLTPELVVNPAKLDVGMVRGQTRTVSFEVFNKGGKVTPQLSVMIPAAPWLTLNTSEVIGVIEPQESKVVTLTLSPDAALPLGPYQGSIYVFGTNTSCAVPFVFQCVSDQFGSLEITAVDEFTYYAEGSPLVENAIFVLRNAFTNESLFVNEPILNGRLLLDNVPEGYYILDVQAFEHSAYRATLYVEPGVTGKITAFMPRELVKYIWTVTPTEIQDVYTVTLETVFETSVPAPVVVIEPANVDLSQMVDGQMQVDFTITNHGLVAAEEFYLAFDNHPRYHVELLTDYNGQIGPGQTVVIPAIITDTSILPLAVKAMSGSPAGDDILSPFLGDCDPVKGGGYYTLVCGKDGKWKKVPVTLANWTCDLYNIIRGISGGDDDDDYDPGHNYEDDYVPDDQWPPETGPSVPIGGGGGGGGVIIPRTTNGGTKPPRTPGDSPKVPIITPPNIEVGGSGGGSCDPCPQALMDAALECAWSFLPTSCPVGIVKSSFDCIRNCLGDDFGSENCLLSCWGSIISVVAGCVAELSGLDTGYNIVMCINSLLDACAQGDSVAYAAAAGELSALTGMQLPAELPTSSMALQRLIEQAERLKSVLDALNVIFGDPIWFSAPAGQEHLLSAWLDTYAAAIDETSDGGRVVTQAEMDVLTTMELPGQLVPEDAQAVCLRWNRTLDYWQQGKFRTTDLQPGDSPDFVAADSLLAQFEEANQAILANEAEGFTTLFGGLDDAYKLFIAAVEPEAKGVCAKVQLRIEQSAVMTRTGFTALLQMQNLSAVDAMENLRVEIFATDIDGNEATMLFGIYPPNVTGISDVNGGGRLDPGQQFESQWLIVPTVDAAPRVQAYYFVGGSIHYTINGRAVTIPIIPDTITVKPDANLHLKYFFQRDVYGDDPFTGDVVEPSVPFILGLMVTNTGAGSAYNMSVLSAQPTIIRQEEDKQILLDFVLLDVQVDDQPALATLQAALGHIDPAQTKTAIWRMRSSLQGSFLDYDAQFAHTDTLGNPRLSLIQSIATHETLAAVRACRDADDTVLDFLTNDIPDVNELPDTLHLSDGTVEPVTSLIGDEAWLTGQLESGQVILSLPHSLDGLFYVRVPNIGWPYYTLKQVIRSDGRILPVENAWTTYKMNYPEDQPSYAENFLHIFDHDAAAFYTLIFEIPDLPPTVSAIEVANLSAVSYLPLELTISYQDEIGMDETTFDDSDITVMDPQGQPLTVQFLQTVAQQGGQMDVLYHIFPPAGLWEAGANGLYSISLAQGQVADVSGQFADSVMLGGFSVSIPHCVQLDVTRCELREQRRLSKTVFEYSYAAIVRNRCSVPVRNARLIPQSVPANLTLTAHDLKFCYIPSGGEAESIGTFTVRIDYDDLPAPLETIAWQWVLYDDSDLTMDGIVNLADVAAFAVAWLTDDPCYDWMPPPEGDGRVNLSDFSVLAEQWGAAGE